MFLTKECDYSIRIIRALADGNKKTVEEICQSELIPYQYAYKIMKKMTRAGFVQGIRGRHGGYILNKPLDTFTIYDVVSSVDENLFMFECLRPDRKCPHSVGKNPCVVHSEFARIQKMVLDEMQGQTVSEVFSR